MPQQNFLAQFAATPLYNTKAVAQETGVPADTFRAWERRYGVPHPHRTEGGHRLYSERDIAIIRWLRDRTEEGLTISQAIALMSNSNGTDVNLSWIDAAVDTEPHSWTRLKTQLLGAFSDFDDKRAEKIIGEAFALYSLDDVFFKLLQPVMGELLETLKQGKISTIAEHFATQFIRRKLASILNTYSITDGRGLILIGCAPSEAYDLGILLLSVLLVRHGWHVIYLGPQVPLEGLLDTVQYLHPDMVYLDASSSQTALELTEIGRVLGNIPPPAPYIAYGGHAFAESPSLVQKVTGLFLGPTAESAIEKINATLSGTPH